MSSQAESESLNFLDSLVLEPPSLSMDRLEEIAPVLAELTPKPKTTTTTTATKPGRRGRKRNADKITPAATSASTGGINGGVTAGDPPEVKPKRGRGRPAGSTNRTSNKLSTAAAVAGAVASVKTDSVEGADQNREDPVNAARERSRVKTLRDAFLELQRSLPSVPPDTKLSKLDVLVLATTYISHLMRTLDDDDQPPLSSPGEDMTGCPDKHHRLKANGYLHPVKKWPMRSRLYAGAPADCLQEISS